MRIRILLAAALASALLLPTASQARSKAKHHVVFQLNEAQGAAWDNIVPHVENLMAAFKKDGGAEVEVVFFGPGVTMLRKANAVYETDLKRLADEGVALAACQNAMRAMNLKTEDLCPFVTKQVDAGVAEVARKQEAGWAYIH